MLIRASGSGPAWMMPPYVTPLRLQLEKLFFIRFFGLMSPSTWATMLWLEGWIRMFFHTTWIGKEIINGLVCMLGTRVMQLKNPNMHPDIRKLKPWRNPFVVGDAPSILNYPTDFFGLVEKGKIKVIIDEVDKFGEGDKILLESGQTLEAAAVVYATGWETGISIEFIPGSLKTALGSPISGTPQVDEPKLLEEVEAELDGDFPFFQKRNRIKICHPYSELKDTPADGNNVNPYRLHRFLVPVSDLERRSIGFVGALTTLGNSSCAYLQSIWLSAYLDGTLSLPVTQDERIKYETYRDTRFSAHQRRTGNWSKFPNLIFHSMPYFDMLIEDLGLQKRRKRRFLGLTNWPAEYFNSYGPEDYRGLLMEWKIKVGRHN
jgi:hypothetical protein